MVVVVARRYALRRQRGSLTFGRPIADVSAAVSLALADEPAYLLVRMAATKWVFVSWIPETTTKTKDRMVYASTHGTLKRALGSQFFADDVHATQLVRCLHKQALSTHRPPPRTRSPPRSRRVALCGQAARRP